MATPQIMNENGLIRRESFRRSFSAKNVLPDIPPEKGFPGRAPFPIGKNNKSSFPKSFTKSKKISVPILNCVVAWQLSSSQPTQFRIF